MPGVSTQSLFQGLGEPAVTARDVEQSRRARAELLDNLRKAVPRRRHSLIVARLLDEVRAVLGLTPADTVDPRQGLNSLGMDSLMAVELRSRLQEAFGISLPVTLAFEHPNINALAEFMEGELGLKVYAEAPAATSAEEIKHSESPDLEDYSEEDLENLLEKKLSTMQAANRGTSGA